MRRILLLTAVITGVAWRPAIAGPGGASGPITVDSTTYVPGSSVMGTDGGVYGDSIPPVASTTTAAFRMTKYRAEHVNLRDNSGAEIGTSGNPLFTTASSTITIGNVTINNSSFSVTGSTVVAIQTDATKMNATVVQATPGNLRVSASISGSSNTVQAQQSGTWNVNSTPVGASTVTFNGTAQPVTISNSPSLAAGVANIGTVTGSSVTIPGTVNTRQVNVSTVIVQSMPAVTVNLSTVTITNSTFSIVGVSSVTVMNQTLTVQLTGATPAGGNNIGTVSGSTVTVNGSVNAAIQGTPNVNVLSLPNVAQTTPKNLQASVSINGSSNTVTSNQGGAWSVTSVQASPANLQVSASLNGSSNTVTAAQTTPANLRASVSISGSSNTVTLTGTPTVGAQQVGTYTVTPGTGTWPISGSVTAAQGPISILGVTGSTLTVGYQAGASSVPVNVLNFPASYPVTGTVAVSNASFPIVSTNTLTVAPASGQAFPIISTNTLTVSGTVTAAQTTAASLQASVSINGSSNTVQVGGSLPAGTNNVGTVTGSTVTIFTSGGTNLPISGTITAISGTNANLRASVDIDGSSNTVVLGAGTANVGKILYQTPTIAVLTSTGITTAVAISTPVAAVAAQTVRVFRLTLTVDTPTNITFRDSATNFGETFYLNAYGSITLDFSGEPWYVTTAGNAFVIQQSGTANIGVRIWYTQS